MDNHGRIRFGGNHDSSLSLLSLVIGTFFNFIHIGHLKAGGQLTRYWMNLITVQTLIRPDAAMPVFILTIILYAISAVISSRKLQSADPADVL